MTDVCYDIHDFDHCDESDDFFDLDNTLTTIVTLLTTGECSDFESLETSFFGFYSG